MPDFATDPITVDSTDQIFFTRVFGWMALGLGVTGGVAYALGRDQRALNVLFGGSGSSIVIVAFVVELLLVWGLAGLTKHLSPVEAAAVFLAFSALNGLTISCIFAVYTTKSIFSAFLVTAGMFAFLAVWGWVTKTDLSGLGNLLLGLLFGQVIGLVVNLFWLNSTLYWVTTATGVLIFSAYTAYDVQRLKKYEVGGDPDDPSVEKAAIVGALALYLDFVNLFLYALRIFGRRR